MAEQKSVDRAALTEATARLEKLLEVAPAEVSRKTALIELRPQIDQLLERGWTERAICDALAPMIPGLTPAALRFASRRQTKRSATSNTKRARAAGWRP